MRSLNVDHVGRSILKSSELGFDRIDLLSLLLSTTPVCRILNASEMALTAV